MIALLRSARGAKGGEQMTPERWELHRFLEPLRREMDKVFDNVFTGRRRGEGAEPTEPPVDVIETDETLVIRA